MRTYGVNGFRSYIRSHIELGCLFFSLVASRSDLFRIVTPPAYALTVVSIVPRTTALFQKFLSAKAEEMKLNRDIMSNGEARTRAGSAVHGKPDSNEAVRTIKAYHTNGVHRTNGIDHSNGGPKSNSALKTNGISSVNSYATAADELHTKCATTPNNRLPMINGDTTLNKNSTLCVEDLFTEYANMVTKAVYDLVKRQGEIMLTSTVIGKLFVIRVNSANPKTEEKYVRRVFEILVAAAEEVLEQT